MDCSARSCLLAPLLPLSRTYFYTMRLSMPSLGLRSFVIMPSGLLMAKALTHYQGKQNSAEHAVPHPNCSETGPLGLTMVALPRLSLTSLQLSWQVAAASQPQLADEASCLARRCLRHEWVEPPEYRRLSAHQHAPDAHFSGPAETLRLAERRGMLSSRVRVPAKHTFTCLSGPVCRCCAVCMHNPVPQGFFSC